MDVRAKVFQTIKVVAAENNKRLEAFDDNDRLLEIGLDSLCMATLIAVLDDNLAVDPFGSGDDVMIPVTVGDLVQVYQTAVCNEAAA
jgi:acyl carrier protein